MRIRCICVLFICLFPGASLGEDGPRQPFELVRSLRLLQDQSAEGNVTAHISQRALLTQIAKDLTTADAAVWKEPRNVRAALTFALSGGDPAAVSTVLSGTPPPGMDEKLMSGVLAFAEGRSSEAWERLGPFDARALDPSIAGHIALVQSDLVAKKDPGKALVFLDQARLLAPGTLIEEAALRRQISIVAAMGNFDKFDSLSSLYLRRFPRSVYASNFRRQFATEIAGHQEYSADPARLAKLGGTLEILDRDHRLDICMTLAKEALARGRVPMVRFAAHIAVGLSEENSAEGARARLYSGAILIMSDEFARGLAILKSIQRTRLDDQDTQLLDAALLAAAEVRRLPAESQARAAGSEAMGDSPKVVEAARRTVALADQMLGGTDK